MGSEMCIRDRWYGSGVYHVGKAIVLASGRPVPPPGEPLQRGEGVALVLSGLAVRAWREAGEQWNACSQRIVSVRLQTGRKQSDTLHVLSFMRQQEQPAEQRRTSFLMTSSRHCLPYRLISPMLSLGISMHVWDPGRQMMTPGLMSEAHMGMGSPMMLGESYWLSWKQM